MSGAEFFSGERPLHSFLASCGRVLLTAYITGFVWRRSQQELGGTVPVSRHLFVPCFQVFIMFYFGVSFVLFVGAYL